MVHQCKKYASEVLVCDDGSKDMTLLQATRTGAHLILHPRNMGYGQSLRDLLKSSMVYGPDMVITLDADGQHDPNDIPKFVKAIEEGADVAAGVRLERHSKTRELGAEVLDAIIRSEDSQCGFRAYKASIVEKIIPSEMGMAAGAEILEKARASGFRITSVPIYVKESRKHSQSAASHGLDVLMSSIKVKAIRRPLVVFGLPGFFFALMGLGFLYWSLDVLVRTGVLPFGPTLAAIASGSLGVSLMGFATMIWIMASIVRER